MATYSEDSDITALDADAADFRPVGEADFSRLRQRGYEEIGRRLARREPPVDQAALGLIDELQHPEVLWALYRLYFEAAAKVGENDTLRWRADQYRRAFEEEMACVRIPADTDDAHAHLRSVRTVPIWRR